MFNADSNTISAIKTDTIIRDDNHLIDFKSIHTTENDIDIEKIFNFGSYYLRDTWYKSKEISLMQDQLDFLSEITRVVLPNRINDDNAHLDAYDMLSFIFYGYKETLCDYLYTVNDITKQIDNIFIKFHETKENFFIRHLSDDDLYIGFDVFEYIVRKHYSDIKTDIVEDEDALWY